MIATDLHSGSDHESLSTTLPLELSPATKRGRFRYVSCDESRFPSLLQPHGMPLYDDPEHEAADIMQVLKLALAASCPRATGSAHGKDFWDDSCARAHRQWLTARRTGPAEDERRRFKMIVQRAKRDFWRRQVDNMQDMFGMYRVVKWHKSQPRYHTPPLASPVRFVSSPTEKTDLLHKSLLSRHIEADDIALDCPTVPQRNVVWPPFTEEEVYSVTCQASSTSPRANEVPVSITRLAWPVLSERIIRLFQACFDKGKQPAVFKEAEVIILPTGGQRNQSLPKSYRPIALLPCLGKGLERLITKRLSYLEVTLHFLTDDQCRAISQCSATDLTTALSCDIQNAWERKMVARAVTMDVKGAFDGVLKGRLIKRLREQGWPDSLTRWTLSFRDERVARIHLDEEVSQTYEILSGLPKGSPVSPILFLLYIEPLLHLSRGRFGYADDICLFVTRRRLETVHDQL